jgi:hypothetical protein
MVTIRSTNDRYGMPETFTGETLAEAVAVMQATIRDCGPEFADVTVTDGDYEVIETAAWPTRPSRRVRRRGGAGRLAARSNPRIGERR